VETTLRKLDGVTAATADFTQKRARVAFDSGRTNAEVIVEAVDELGIHGSLDDKS
jgi:copper chaperone CopZ